MKLIIEIDMDGAAFENPWQLEEIFQQIHRGIEEDREYLAAQRRIRDAYGNSCGAWLLEP